MEGAYPSPPPACIPLKSHISDSEPCPAASLPADHYAAKLAGLIPEDPVAALLSDQVYFFILLDVHNGVSGRTSCASGSLACAWVPGCPGLCRGGTLSYMYFTVCYCAVLEGRRIRCSLIDDQAVLHPSEVPWGRLHGFSAKEHLFGLFGSVTSTLCDIMLCHRGTNVKLTQNKGHSH